MRVQNYSFQMNEPKIYLTNIRFYAIFHRFTPHIPFVFIQNRSISFFYPSQREVSSSLHLIIYKYT